MPRAARGSTKRSRGSRRRTSARSMAFARTSCANAPWRQEWIPCSRSSPNRRRRGSSMRPSTGWLQEQLADPREGLRRALRRYGLRRRGRPRSIACARRPGTSPQWRDFTTAWTRPPFERHRRDRAGAGRSPRVCGAHPTPHFPERSALRGHRAIRRLSDEIMLAAILRGRRARLRRLGSGSRRSFPGSDPRKRKDRARRSYANGVARDRVLQARVALKARLDQFRMDADADLAALLQRDLRGAIDRYDELKARAGALDFLDLLLGARDLVRDNAVVRAGVPGAASSGSSSTSSRTRIRCRPRSCCCSPPTTTPRRTGDA